MTNETLYNGINLPQTWPPRNVVESSREPIPVPYLSHPPQVIPIDLGRQLFVDDFLIAETSLTRAFGKPESTRKARCLAPKPMRRWIPVTARWPRPSTTAPGTTRRTTCSNYGICPAGSTAPPWPPAPMAFMATPATRRHSGTNLVWPNNVGSDRDGCLVWLDSDTPDPAQRYKMFQFYRHYKPKPGQPPIPPGTWPTQMAKEAMVSEGWAQVSPDGIHWSDPVITTQVGDNTSFFYNPFRRKWCMSIRRSARIDESTRLRAASTANRTISCKARSGTWRPARPSGNASTTMISPTPPAPTIASLSTT